MKRLGILFALLMLWPLVVMAQQTSTINGLPPLLTNPLASSVIPLSQNGVTYKSTVSQIIAGGGVVAGPSSSTIGYVPQWGNTVGSSLTAGLPVGTTGVNSIIKTGAGGLLVPSILPLGTNSVIGAVECDGTTITCSSGIISTLASGTVDSITGDGTLINNSASTGAVTLTLGNATAKSLWGNPTSSSATPVYTVNPIVSGSMTSPVFNTPLATGLYEINGNTVLFLPDGDTTSIAVGESALASQSATSSANTAVGLSALTTLTTGADDTAVGYNSLYKTTGSNNVALGTDSGEYITSGTNNTAIGLSALMASSGSPLTGNYNTAIGENALEILNGASNYNTVIGQDAGMAVTVASYNTVVGAQALATDSTTSGETAVGYSALGAATGAQNTAIGYEAAGAVVSGTDNTMLGWSAGIGVTGSSNIMLGEDPSSAITTGSSNILIGNSLTGVTNTSSNQVDIADTMVCTGTGTPSTSTCTFKGALTGVGAVTGNTLVSTVSTGTAPLTVTSTTNVAHLNASTLTGYAVGTSGAAIPLMNGTNTWAGSQIMTSGDLYILGSSTGSTAIASANSSGTNYTWTIPAVTDTAAGALSTTTFTNKTYDTAGTGNTFRINGTGITAISGNTGTVGTTSGTLTSGHGAKFDASGNIVDSGSAPTTGTVTSIATTSPITGGTITTTGTIACATCATTTNGGALSGTSPIAISAAGAISIADAAADGATLGAAAFNSTNFSASSGVVNTIQGISTAATPQFTRLGLGQAADSTASIAYTQAIGNTSTDGEIIQNATAATSGAQKWSPRIRWTGHGWKTGSGGSSQEVDAIAEVQPVQGSSNPTFNWVLSGQVASGGYGALLTVPSGGNLNLNSGNYQVNGTQIACSSLSNGATGCSSSTGTSGHTLPFLDGNNTFSGQALFQNSDILLVGSSTGYTTFTSGNSSSSNYTLTFPAATDQLVGRATTDTLTNKSIAGSEVNSGTVSATYLPQAAADGATLGVAAFNSTNFSAAAGVVNTIQGISTAANPQFATLGVGGAAGTEGLEIIGSPSTGTGQVGLYSAPVFTSASTVSGSAIYTAPATAAASFTQSAMYGIHITNPTKGSGSTITTLYGIEIDGQTVGGTNYAIYDTSGPSYFGGGVTVNNLSASTSGNYACINTSTKALEYANGTCSVSDETKKHDVVAITGGLAEVMKFEPVSFYYNAGLGLDDKQHVGFTAQRMEKVDKRFVEYDEKGHPDGIDYDKIPAMNTAAIQDMQHEIEALRPGVFPFHKCFFGLLVCAD